MFAGAAVAIGIATGISVEGCSRSTAARFAAWKVSIATVAFAGRSFGFRESKLMTQSAIGLRRSGRSSLSGVTSWLR